MYSTAVIVIASLDRLKVNISVEQCNITGITVLHLQLADNITEMLMSIYGDNYGTVYSTSKYKKR